MKTLLTIVVFINLISSAFAQGTIEFKNTNPPRLPIYESDGTTPLTGTAYLVDLYFGPLGSAPSSFASAGLAQPFFTGFNAGYFDAGNIAIPFIAGGSQVQIQARAWRAADGATWAMASSAPGAHVSPVTAPVVTIQLGGTGVPPSPAASFAGSQISHSLIIVPEPSTMLLVAAGLMAMVSLRRKR